MQPENGTRNESERIALSRVGRDGAYENSHCSQHSATEGRCRSKSCSSKEDAENKFRCPLVMMIPLHRRNGAGGQRTEPREGGFAAIHGEGLAAGLSAVLYQCVLETAGSKSSADR